MLPNQEAIIAIQDLQNAIKVVIQHLHWTDSFLKENQQKLQEKRSEISRLPATMGDYIEVLSYEKVLLQGAKQHDGFIDKMTNALNTSAQSTGITLKIESHDIGETNLEAILAKNESLARQLPILENALTKKLQEIETASVAQNPVVSDADDLTNLNQNNDSPIQDINLDLASKDNDYALFVLKDTWDVLKKGGEQNTALYERLRTTILTLDPDFVPNTNVVENTDLQKESLQYAKDRVGELIEQHGDKLPVTLKKDLDVLKSAITVNLNKKSQASFKTTNTSQRPNKQKNKAPTTDREINAFVTEKVNDIVAVLGDITSGLKKQSKSLFGFGHGNTKEQVKLIDDLSLQLKKMSKPTAFSGQDLKEKLC